MTLKPSPYHTVALLNDRRILPRNLLIRTSLPSARRAASPANITILVPRISSELLSMDVESEIWNVIYILSRGHCA